MIKPEQHKRLMKPDRKAVRAITLKTAIKNKVV